MTGSWKSRKEREAQTHDALHIKTCSMETLLHEKGSAEEIHGNAFRRQLCVWVRSKGN